MDNQNKALYFLQWFIQIMITWIITDYCMDRIWHSDKLTIELFTYIVVYFALDYVWKTIRKSPKTEETEKVCIIPENLSEEDKCEIMKLMAEGQKVKAIKKAREVSGAGLLEAKQYVESL